MTTLTPEAVHDLMYACAARDDDTIDVGGQLNTPAERAVFCLYRRIYDLRAALRYLVWKVMRLSDHTIQSIAKRIDRQPIWVHRRLSDDGPFDFTELGAFTVAMDFSFDFSVKLMVRTERCEPEGIG